MTKRKKASEAAAERRRVSDRRKARAEQARLTRIDSLGFNRKLDRASHHIETLRKITEAWLGGDAYELVPDSDPETQRTVVRAKITEPPPAAIATIAGDAVHNLRCALDHVALELAIAHALPDPLPSQVERGSEFPVFAATVGTSPGSAAFHQVKTKTGEPVPGSGLHKLRGVHPDALKVIEGIQPYHRGTAYAADPLWVIHELDRIDKHRRTHLTACAMGGVEIGNGYIDRLHIEKAGYNGPVEDGTEVASFTVGGNSNFQMNFAREITFAEPSLPDCGEVVACLTNLRDYVRDSVVPALTPFL